MDTEPAAERTTGVVEGFHVSRGFGFIQPEGTEDKDDRVFVHWSDLNSGDNYAHLKKGMTVEFEITDGEDGKKRAAKVSMPGGEPIALPEDERECSETHYFGTVKFYDSRKGFGFIVPETDIEYEGETVKQSEDRGNNGVFVSRPHIISKDSRHRLGRVRVRFQVYKDKKGLGAINVTDPEGEPIAAPVFTKKRKLENADERKKKKKDEESAKKQKTEGEADKLPETDVFDMSERHNGTVKFWNIGRCFGWVTPTDGPLTYMGNEEDKTEDKTEEAVQPDTVQPESVPLDRIYFHQSAFETDHAHVTVPKGLDVTFNLYKGPRGFGCGNVQRDDGEEWEEAPPAPKNKTPAKKKAQGAKE